jgi:hypothetical protein
MIEASGAKPAERAAAMNAEQIREQIANSQESMFSANYIYGLAYARECGLANRVLAGESGLESEIAEAQQTQRDALKVAKEAFMVYSDAVIALAKSAAANANA